jgi:hypothetical protein
MWNILMVTIKILFQEVANVEKNNTTDHAVYLTCKGVRFCARKDEDAFFEWIKKIKCIKSFEGARDELYLDLVDRPLRDKDLDDLIGLLYRYKIDMKQLAQFLTPKNKPWFYDNKKAFWHRRVFGLGPQQKQ